MKIIRLKAYAKINLGLDVIKKREDGYHEVKMIMQTINLYDKLTIRPTVSPSIRISTNLRYLPTDSNNIVYKAASFIIKEYNIKQGVCINLEKKIPVSAGMAGGSADAATTLIGLNQLFNLNIPINELMSLGVLIGADVPYCIMKGTALSEGIGEKLKSLPPFPACHVLVVKPQINVSTKYVYENLKLDESIIHPNIDAIVSKIHEKDLIGATRFFGNVLETVTEKEYPIITDIKQTMMKYGAVCSLMSGSGPTVFGIFDNINLARKAFYEFKISRFGKQVYLTELHQPSSNVIS